MKVFRDYAEVNEKMLEGYTIVAVTQGVNESDTGILFELEREVGSVTLGIDVMYNPDCGEDETEMMISNEYVREGE